MCSVLLRCCLPPDTVRIRPLSDTVLLWSGSSFGLVVGFAADFKRNNREDECRLFRFPSNTKEYKKCEDYLSNFSSPKNYGLDLLRQCDGQLATANIVNRTVSFENELVPLNGRII